MRRAWLSLLLFAPIALAQQPAPGSAPAAVSDHELIQQLLDRVRELEGEVRQLRAANAANAAAPATPATPAPTVAQTTPPPAQAVPQNVTQVPAPAAASAAAATQTVPPMDQGMHDINLPGMPTMQFRGFSDIRYRATSDKTPNTFQLGQFDLFITSKLTDKFNVLSEVVVEADPTNTMGIDLERLLFQYNANDYFNLSVGRYHTAIGWYNTAYHHSTWLQTAFDRPFLYQFEDSGGILPIHGVGMSATGLIPSGTLGLHWTAEISNGRASRSPVDEAVQNVQDENNGKAVNFALYAKPDWLRGFQTGFSVYHDVLHPAVTYDFTPFSRSIGQNIFAAYGIYQGSRVEFLNEAVVLRHAIDNGPVYHIPAFYSQISVPFGKLRPYFRYEYMNVPRGEPMFGDVGLRHGPFAGIRYDFTDYAAFKVEYFRLLLREFNPTNGLRTQVAFTF
jgi:hypothetical protein